MGCKSRFNTLVSNCVNWVWRKSTSCHLPKQPYHLLNASSGSSGGLLPKEMCGVARASIRMCKEEKLGRVLSKAEGSMKAVLHALTVCWHELYYLCYGLRVHFFFAQQLCLRTSLIIAVNASLVFRMELVSYFEMGVWQGLCEAWGSERGQQWVTEVVHWTRGHL